jgi:hypothetical protein
MPNCCGVKVGRWEWAVWPISRLFWGAIVVGVASALVKGEQMNEGIGTNDRLKTAATVVVAALVLLVVALVSMLQPAPTTDASTPIVHPGVHAMSTGGRGFAEDSYIERHAEVVAAYQQDGPR